MRRPLAICAILALLILTACGTMSSAPTATPPAPTPTAQAKALPPTATALPPKPAPTLTPLPPKFAPTSTPIRKPMPPLPTALPTYTWSDVPQVITPTIHFLENDDNLPSTKYIEGAFTSISFVDAQHGWLADGNNIHATSDGGKTWRKQFTAPESVSAINFLSADLGWADTANQILGTSDGGKTWQVLFTPTDWQPGLLHFVNANEGFVTVFFDGLIQFMHTADGGHSWAQLANPCSQEKATHKSDKLDGKIGGSISFIQPEVGWALCPGELRSNYQDKELFKTTDGGVTWQLLTRVVMPQGRPNDPLSAAGYGAAILFIDEQHAWMTGVLGALRASEDGGYTWHGIDITKGEQYGFFRYPSLTTGGVGAVVYWQHMNEDLLLTTDGGVSWQQIYPALAPGGMAQLIDPQNGIGTYAEEDWPAILKTTDSGQSWTRISSLYDHCFEGVERLSFPDPQHGWAIGNSCERTGKNLLYRTADGGVSWELLPTCRNYCAEVSFVDDKTGYTLSRDGVAVTHDGGDSFTVVTQQNFAGLQFATADRGWAVERDTHRLRSTADGGKTWQYLVQPGPAYGFDLLPDGHAWVVSSPRDKAPCSLLASP